MRVWLFAAACALLPGSAMAQWRAAAFLGDAATGPADLAVTSPGADTAATLSDVRLDDESFRSPVYYGWRIGRSFARVPWLGIEGEFIHAKVVSRAADVVRVRGRVEGATVEGDRPVGSVLPRFALSHGFNFLLLNAVARLPLGADGPRARVVLTGRGGAGPTLPHVEASVGDDRADAYQWGRVGGHAAAGVDAGVTHRLSVTAEIKWTATRQAVSIGESRVSGTLRTRHLANGLAWQF